MDSRVTLVLAAAVLLVAVVLAVHTLQEGLAPMQPVPLPAATKTHIETGIVHMLANAYAKAADDVAKLPAAKRTGAALKTAATGHVNAAVNSKFPGFVAANKTKLNQAVTATRATLDSQIAKQFSGGSASKPITNVNALKKLLVTVAQQSAPT